MQRALADAEALLKTRGPVSAVDRLHTALHGHLVHVCREAGIALGNDPSVTQRWSVLIAQHPSLQIPDVRREDIKKILRSATRRDTRPAPGAIFDGGEEEHISPRTARPVTVDKGHLGPYLGDM